MAEETKNTPKVDRSMVAPAPSDEVIDLEGIVRDIDQGAPQAPLHAEELSHDKIDELLMEESPELASEMAAIREVATSKEDAGKDEVEIKPLEQDDSVAQAALQGHAKITFRERIRFQLLRLVGLIRAGKDLAKRAAKDSKGVLRELLIRAKVSLVAGIANRREEVSSGLKWLRARSTAQKVSLLVSIFALAGLVLIAMKMRQGTLLPKTEKVWIANFADVADGDFRYEADGEFEDFNDPLLHPEFVIVIERIVVNLARTPEASESANPMAAFELYLQTDNQEAAVEIKDRSVEIKDSLSRAVERMTYADLVGEEGKAKLKLLIRRDLNGVLTRGKVRRVFFKTIVLNPE